MFSGVWIPIVTPFRQGQIDLPAFERLVAYYIDAGVHGIVVGGTTGEGAALSNDEKHALVIAAIDVSAHRCPVVLGVGGVDTAQVAASVREFDREDLAGFLVPPPYYVGPSQEGILWHYREIVQGTERPIILYNVPRRIGANIEPATAIALAENDSRFAAIKECNGDNIQPLVESAAIDVLGGDDTLLLYTLLEGGMGVMAASAHVWPERFVRLYEAVEDEDFDDARLRFEALLPLIRLLFSEPNPAPVKAALALEGLVRDELRLPMTSASAALQLELEAHLGGIALPMEYAPLRLASAR
jgi:4-hydroxy-tetrahydrodipicolinate synthase